jgi:hypothetical protein
MYFRYKQFYKLLFMKNKILIPKLSTHDRVWLQEVYINNVEGNRISTREIWHKIEKKLPPNFRPEKVDFRFLTNGGELIRVLGIIALQKNYQILKKIDSVIYSTKEVIVSNPNLKEILIADIEQKTGYNAGEISFYLRLASDYKIFYNGSTFEENSRVFKSIYISDDINIFYNYREFKGIENIIITKTKEEEFQREEIFHEDEIYSLNNKIDEIEKTLKKMNLIQESKFEEFKNELSEMKYLYSLSKKNWWRLLSGKLNEMIISGIISETISKKIVEYLLIPAIKLLKL